MSLPPQTPSPFHDEPRADGAVRRHRGRVLFGWVLLALAIAAPIGGGFVYGVQGVLAGLCVPVVIAAVLVVRYAGRGGMGGWHG